MSTRLLRPLSVLIVVSLLTMVAGCVPTAPPAPPATEAPPQAPAETPVAPESAAPSEPINIGVYTVAWSPSSQAMMAELIDLFNEEHAGKIEAEYIQGDWGEGDTYVSAGVAGGGGIADVVEWWVGGAQAWYEQGFLHDLSPYVTDEMRSTMPEEFWAARTMEDGAVFFSGTVCGEHSLLYYNPELFAEAGVDPPPPGSAWTWEEFLENAKKLTVDADGQHLGQEGFDPNNVVQWGFLPRLDDEKVWEEASIFAMQASGKPMIRKGSDGSWDIFFDEEAIPALRTFFGVIEEGISPDLSIGLSGDSQDEAFAQGQAAMVLRGYFNIGVLHDRYPDFDFAVMSTPMQPGTKYYINPTGGQGFAVPITSPHPEAAAEFVFWFQKMQPQAMWSSALYLAPCNPQALDDPLLKDDPNWDAMRFYKSIEAVADAEYNVNQEEFLTTLYAPSIMAVVQGEKSLDDAIEEIKAGSKDILNQ
jgi:multiple sugar transport system substrate-binding protein